MRIVVTGGAGFIGANLVRALLERGHTPVVLDDLSTGSRANLDDVDVAFHEGTILDPALLDVACEGAQAIVHLAARPSVPRSIEDPMASHLANATGTVQVLEAARRHGNLHTVLASSSSVYGRNPTLPKSEDMLTQPMSPYAVSKLATEQYALAYAACYDLPVLPFRFFNVYGPLQAAGHAYAAVIPAFLDAALRDQPIPINGDGLQSRDFTFIGTVTDAIATAVERATTSPDPVNLAFGTRRTLLDVITAIETRLGRELARTHGADRPGDVRHSQADGARIAALLPDVAPEPFEAGLRATLEWFLTLPEYAGSADVPAHQAG
ncbi:MAG: NAD-dependent epimerase/dehydratase family protein [Nitriliruptoraceae bacterium]|nr:NAD-dependent epimerase/dehydratase family protein [Nitriliruptoraceae bacterium]